MSESASAPADSAARAISAMSVTFGESLTMSGFFAFAFAAYFAEGIIPVAVFYQRQTVRTEFARLENAFHTVLIHRSLRA